MQLTKREFLLRTLFGAGSVGLTALATGLPTAFLTNPRRALAQGMPTGMCSDRSAAQYLILSTSGSGDPSNANVPGTYEHADIVHAADPSMAATQINLGGTRVRGAQVWSTLPQWVLDRTNFFHHATYTNSHPNLAKVLRLMGSTARQESLPSIFAKHLAGCLGTVQREPVVVGAGNILTFDGRALPSLSATALRDTLARPAGPIGQLQRLRDAHMDQIQAILRENSTQAQRGLLDRFVISREQARNISEDLLETLASITSDGPDGQIAAAATLVRMNVAPVVVLSLPFGGDNHSDAGMMVREVPQTQASVARISTLFESLRTANVHDRVTFALLNVFGRTLKNQGQVGRTHHANHHAGIIISSRARAGVTGGLVPLGNDYGAANIDSRTGRPLATGGDIPRAESLESYAKTLGRALGVPNEVLDTNITKGRVVQSAVVA